MLTLERKNQPNETAMIGGGAIMLATAVGRAAAAMAGGLVVPAVVARGLLRGVR